MRLLQPSPESREALKSVVFKKIMADSSDEFENKYSLDKEMYPKITNIGYQEIGYYGTGPLPGNFLYYKNVLR